MEWESFIEAHREVVREIADELKPVVESVAAGMALCIRKGGKILICGNGGSAADAQHFAAELVNRFQLDRRPYAAIALTTDSSILTSVGNDFDFSQIYSKQVEALAKPEDILVAISTSGNADNIVMAVQAAKQIGAWTVAMTGGNGGKVNGLADQPLRIASSSVTARIQEGHIMLIHALCEMIEEQLAE